MRKVIFLTVAFMLVLVAAPVFAKGGPSAPAGKSNKAHLNLYQKCPDGEPPCPWENEELWGSAWGKMAYDQSGETFSYVFNGHGLEAGENYTLIYYPDPWPGNDLICLGDGMANGGGNVHISSAVDTGDLPTTSDENYHWNLEGDWILSFVYGGTYVHDMTVTSQSDGSFEGIGSYPSGVPPTTTWTVAGTTSGNSVEFRIEYDGSSYFVDVLGEIDENDGSMSGTWSNNSQSGTWTSTDGTATLTEGAKIWLVLSDDVICDNTSQMDGWAPESYLFEYDMVTFDDVD